MSSTSIKYSNNMHHYYFYNRHNTGSRGCESFFHHSLTVYALLSMFSVTCINTDSTCQYINQRIHQFILNIWLIFAQYFL